ncbi:MAG TPA: hypothetical protein VF870_02830 [Ignavibacteriaceae bacterium]
MKYFLFALTILLTLNVNSTFSQIQAQSSSNINNHDGFFLRMLLGFGQTDLTEEMDYGGDLKMSGVGTEFRVQIGGCVSENLILFGDLGGVVVMSPNIEWAGNSTSSDNTSLTISEFGGGLTYYFMPENIYVSFSAVLPVATIEFNTTKGESKMGFGFFLSAGKEWWIAEQWGLGAALYGSYGSMKDKGEFADNAISTYSFGVAFSATLN